MSTVPYWLPPVTLSSEEERLVKRLTRVRKLFRFLREWRHELFDEAFQDELATMYRSTGAGRTPLPPAMLCMVTLLQAYMQTSDADAVELSVVDRRWQMVLGCLGADEPLFSQGALPAFRARLIEHGMDQRLLERTIELARRTGAFDPKALSRLRVAVDSAPFEGAGRVEDTINLLGHAARNLLGLCGFWLDRRPGELVAELDLRLVGCGSSVKANMDIDWSDRQARSARLQDLYAEVQRIIAFARDSNVPELRAESSCSASTVEQICAQDLEVGEIVSIRQGVARNRRVSIEDAAMRHGRKSQSRRFDGYKRHLAIDLDSNLVLHCGVGAANQHDSEHMEELRLAMEAGGWEFAELHIDRGYLPAPFVAELYECGTDIVARPWTARPGGRFSKADFTFDLRRRTLRCPAGAETTWQPGRVARFSDADCADCELRERCTSARSGGRTITMSRDEVMHEKLRRRLRTSSGRRRLRERVAVEHGQAHLVARQGRRARYFGMRKTLFDVRRCAAVQNLHTSLLYLDRTDYGGVRDAA